MEEQKDKKVCDCASCKCACGNGYWHWHMILRIVIAVIVVIAAFWIGLRLGELRAAYYGIGNRGGYGGYRMMRGYPANGGYGQYGGTSPMMQYAPSASATSTK